MKVEIDIQDETLDEAFRNNLVWHIDNAEDEFARFKSIKNPTPSQLEELKYFTELVPALKIVGEYFGVKKYMKRRNKSVK